MITPSLSADAAKLSQIQCSFNSNYSIASDSREWNEIQFDSGYPCPLILECTCILFAGAATVDI